MNWNIQSKDVIILQGWMLIEALRVSILKTRIVWTCTMAKLSDSSVSIPLYSQLLIRLIQDKNFSTTVLPKGMTHSIWSLRIFKQNIETVNNFLAASIVIFPNGNLSHFSKWSYRKRWIYLWQYSCLFPPNLLFLTDNTSLDGMPSKLNENVCLFHTVFYVL